jgi:hypothetical protein
MAEYLGKSWTKEQLESYVGDMHQIAGAQPFVCRDGKADGVRGVRIDTGSGFRFTLLPGRGMDIPEASYNQKALHLFSGTGVTAPGYYDEPGLEWLRTFYVGLLTTCGIANSGAPSVDGGEPFGLHGRIANAAAEDLATEQWWDGDDYRIRVRGKMREAKTLFENLSLTRTVETGLGRRGFTLHDLIENHGFEPQPLMMLYHFNFGFPLLGPKARIIAPVRETVPRDEEAEKDNGVAECLRYPEPVRGYNEKVFFHTLAAREDGSTFVSLWNDDTGDGSPLGIVLRFNKKELPAFTQWKMPRMGLYVTGLEPGTAPPLGRGVVRERGELPLLEGRESYGVTVRFEVYDAKTQARTLEKEAADLAGA